VKKGFSDFAASGLSATIYSKSREIPFQAFSPLFQGVREKVNCMCLLILAP
jgi:hypothetical protein